MQGLLKASVTLAVAQLLLVGCQIDGGHEPGPCVAQNGDGNWTAFGYTANVQTPARCPIELDTAGQPQPLQGTLSVSDSVDEGTQAAQVSVFNAEEAQVLFHNENWAKDPMSHQWIVDYNNLSYPAGTGAESPFAGRDRDTLTFLTQGYYQDDPIGVAGGVDLPWTQDPYVEVSGPAEVSPVNFVTISADVANGKFPLTFQWYHNDTLVATNTRNAYSDSYTTWALSPGTHVFHVEVADAEGDAGGWETSVHSCNGCGQ